MGIDFYFCLLLLFSLLFFFSWYFNMNATVFLPFLSKFFSLMISLNLLALANPIIITLMRRIGLCLFNSCIQSSYYETESSRPCYTVMKTSSGSAHLVGKQLTFSHSVTHLVISTSQALFWLTPEHAKIRQNKMSPSSGILYSSAESWIINRY